MKNKQKHEYETFEKVCIRILKEKGCKKIPSEEELSKFYSTRDVVNTFCKANNRIKVNNGKKSKQKYIKCNVDNSITNNNYNYNNVDIPNVEIQDYYIKRGKR